jgi:pilus assembly protein FimV
MAAASLLLCLWGTSAAALSLGRITVQSALGEPLRAEIEIPDINADEAASLRATVALPEAFRAAGLDYNAAMATVQVSLQRRQDGRAFIRLTGDRAINEPFVDMILEARWASGRIVRDYTMLFDPPKVNQPAPVAPTQAQTPTPPPSRVAAAQPAPFAPPAVAPQRTAPPAPPSSPAKAPAETEGAVTVKTGDTAGKIAAAIKPANVSLDQMLVAMLRANPDAFIGDNVNRIRAGAIINAPTADQATATPPAEASRIIFAQSKDFNDFRRKLAGSAPSTTVAEAGRQASGQVQAQVEDKKPATTTPDKLTLTKGAVQEKAAAEQLAKDRSAKEAASRAAEIARNISELSKLEAASSSVKSAPAAPDVKPSPVPAPVVTAASPVPPPPAQPASAPASSPQAAAPKPVAALPKPAASALTPAPVAAEPGLLDHLIEEPLIPAGALGLITLLAGWGVYRLRQRKKAAQDDSAFLESRLRPDSFFGASGGQSIDTNEGGPTGSSMVYSPSQLDAVDDVDPVAEADVYLAYGRDMQAEEILKDALRNNPKRLAIHRKLLEIHAKRRDTLAFESVAKQAFNLIQGDDAAWEQICEQGRSIDPTNSLYQPGGRPDMAQEMASKPAPLGYANTEAQEDESAEEMPRFEPSGPVDLDLDLDFSLDDEPASVITETSSSAGATAAAPAPEFRASAPVDLEFELESPLSEPAALPEIEQAINAMDFSLPDLDIAPKDQPPRVAEPSPEPSTAIQFESTSLPNLVQEAKADAEPPAEDDMGMLEFDLESLSLDLGESVAPESSAEPEAQEDPLVTKLALAEEFRAIGDDDGARALIEEVIAEASGDMKAKAQRALDNL